VNHVVAEPTIPFFNSLLVVFTQRLAQEDERSLLAWNPVTEDTVYELAIRFSDKGQEIRLAPASP
jgi:hypothetical protein